MNRFHIQFIYECSNCESIRKIDLKRLGQSHVEWLTDAKNGNGIENWKCIVCKKECRAKVLSLNVEEE